MTRGERDRHFRRFALLLSRGLPSAWHRRAAEQDTASKSRGLRGLMWTHLGYLGLLPYGAVVAGGDDLAPAAVFFSFAPVVVWQLALASGYRLTRRPFAALVVVLAVPLQVAASCLLWRGGLLGFLYESAVVELSCFALGLVVAMAWHRPSGVGGAIGIAVLLLLPWLGVSWPLLEQAMEWDAPAQTLLVTAFVTGLVEYGLIFATAARQFNETGRGQHIALHFGGADADGYLAPAPTEAYAAMIALIGTGSWLALFFLASVFRVF